MSSWFSQVAQLVDTTFDKVMQQVSAAQTELQQEQQKLASEVASTQATKASDDTLLPWETTCEALQILSNDAMERMLQVRTVRVALIAKVWDYRPVLTPFYFPSHSFFLCPSLLYSSQ